MINIIMIFQLENILSDDDLNLKLGSFELACAVESDVELKGACLNIVKILFH